LINARQHDCGAPEERPAAPSRRENSAFEPSVVEARCPAGVCRQRPLPKHM
jgi:hypothetical protein